VFYKSMAYDIKRQLHIHQNKNGKVESLRIHIPKQKRQKWDTKNEKGIFVGYSNSTKCYQVW